MAAVPFPYRAWDGFGLWREAKGGVPVAGCTGLRAQSLCGGGTLVSLCVAQNQYSFPNSTKGCHALQPTSWCEAASR